MLFFGVLITPQNFNIDYEMVDENSVLYTHIENVIEWLDESE